MVEAQITESDKTERQKCIERVLDRLLDGTPLKKAVEAEGIVVRTFHRWLSGDREASLSYARALELLADLEVDEAKAIADSEPDAAKARNQIDIRKWRASKRHARVYGDRIDLNVTQTLDISATLQEARTRLLRPVRDQLEASDVQVIDLPRQITQGTSALQAVDRPRGDEEPDIFG